MMRVSGFGDIAEVGAYSPFRLHYTHLDPESRESESAILLSAASG